MTLDKVPAKTAIEKSDTTSGFVASISQAVSIHGQDCFPDMTVRAPSLRE